MLNFNNANEQKEGGGGNGPIPAKSFVKLRMKVRPPGEAQRSPVDPNLTISKKNKKNYYANCEFEVVAGTYQGLNIWANYVVVGSEKATNISMAFLRGVLESARGIQPGDSSQQATTARQINAWQDFSGMEFVAMVGIKKPVAGDLYINNDIMRAITPDKPEYQAVMSGGEIISSNPIPAIPGSASGETGAVADGQKDTWVAPQNQSQQSLPGMQQQDNQQIPLPNEEPPEAHAGNKPAWA